MKVWIGNSVCDLWVADNSVAWEKGLQWVIHIDPQWGMIFMFPEDACIPIWMKGVHIPLDILWIWSHMNILHIWKEASPEINGIFQEHCPNVQARFVIELHGGFCRKNGIDANSSVTFLSDFWWGNSGLDRI